MTWRRERLWSAGEPGRPDCRRAATDTSTAGPRERDPPAPVDAGTVHAGCRPCEAGSVAARGRRHDEGSDHSSADAGLRRDPHRVRPPSRGPEVRARGLRTPRLRLSESRTAASGRGHHSTAHAGERVTVPCLLPGELALAAARGAEPCRRSPGPCRPCHRSGRRSPLSSCGAALAARPPAPAHAPRCRDSRSERASLVTPKRPPPGRDQG